MTIGNKKSKPLIVDQQTSTPAESVDLFETAKIRTMYPELKDKITGPATHWWVKT